MELVVGVKLIPIKNKWKEISTKILFGTKLILEPNIIDKSNTFAYTNVQCFKEYFGMWEC